MINEIIVFSAAAGIIFLGFAGELFFKKTGVSYCLFLISIGIVLGPIFSIFPREPLILVLGLFASFTLIMILFYSGMDMRIKEVIRGSPRTVVQVTIYVVSSIFLIGISLADTFMSLAVYVIILTNIVTTIGSIWIARKNHKIAGNKIT